MVILQYELGLLVLLHGELILMVMLIRKLMLMVMVICVVMCMVTLPHKWFLAEVVSMAMLLFELVLLGISINGTGDG